MKIDRLDQNEILRYLGYRDQEVTPQIQKLMDKCEEQALNLLDPKYVYGRFEISEILEGIRVQGTDLILKGKDIAEHLTGCREVILMGATAGMILDRWIRRYMVTEPDAGVVLDSCGIQAIEQIMDEVEKEVEAQVLAEGFHMTWRFSPGYGDLPLETQKDLVRTLDLSKRIGVSLTESCLMVPSKSVTAIIGIYDPKKSEENRSDVDVIKKQRKENACDFCNNKDRCLFRKRGTRC